MKIFESVAKLKASRLSVGQIVKCKRYYDSGSLVEDLLYEIQASASVDGFLDHALANGNVARLVVSGDVSVIKAGARNGVDSTANIQAANDYATSSNRKVIVENVNDAYVISDTISVTCDWSGYGRFKTDGVMNNKPMFSLDAPYLKFKNMTIVGLLFDRNNGVQGLLIPEGSFGCSLSNLDFSVLDIGITIRTFTITIVDCKINSNNTNVSAWTASPTSEINNINILGGQYWGAIDYAVFFGDDRFSPITGKVMGWGISLIGVDLENCCSRFGNVGNVNIFGCYFEGPTSNITECNGKHIFVKGDPNLVRTFSVNQCHFVQGDYGVFCNSTIIGISVEDCTFTEVLKCGLRVANGLGKATFKRNTTLTSSFSEGIPFHTGVASGAGPEGLSYYEDDEVGVAGNQFKLGSAPATALGGARYVDASGDNFVKTAGTTPWRTYTTPKTSISGTKSGTFVQLTIPSEIAGFNAGDAITINGSSSNIFQIDYDSGFFFTNFVGADGAVTIEQIATSWTAL